MFLGLSFLLVILTGLIFFCEWFKVENSLARTFAPSEQLTESKAEVVAMEISSSDEQEKIENYRVEPRNATLNEKTYRTLRSFNYKGQAQVLAIDLETNKTIILPEVDLTFLSTDEIFENSAYKKALDSLQGKKGTANQVLKRSKNSNDIYFTADFCPSSKSGFEQAFFEKFIATGHKNIGIAITKAWVDQHSDGFEWLLNKQDRGDLNITWINHSANHHYHFNEPDLSKNFLLLPDTNLEEEIFEVEKMLIERGETPSIFMRFPGLVSSEDIRKQLIEHYGLVFIGSNAWLAKGERPMPGSIVLIHGNKNEPLGITKAFEFLESYNGDLFGNLEGLFK